MTSQFPGLPHHQIKVGITVYGGADPTVIQFKFIIVHLQLKI